MEVLRNSNHGNAFGAQYHRYSSLSLASAANSEDNYSIADQSFHTCFEGHPTEDSAENFASNSVSMTGRVASFVCLANVQEEDQMDLSSSPQPARQAASSLVSLPPYSQLHQLTASRFALSSTIGVLRRSVDSSFAENPTKVLMGRDQMMTYYALPMSRSFATPRMAVNTAFRSCASSLGSCTSLRKSTDTVAMIPPVILAIESQVPSRSSRAKPVILTLEALPDDVQLQILAFLPFVDIRSLMSTNRQFRKLMFTSDAQNLWQHWCDRHKWCTFLQDMIVVDDLSLPTAARPKSEPNDSMIFSPWHQQANLSLLLSMAQSQPTEIDVEQLNEYLSHQPALFLRSRHRLTRNRIHTTDGNRPLLQYLQPADNSRPVVQFTGRVGHGDRCVRANKPFPRPTLIRTGEWMVPPSQPGTYNKKPAGHGKHHQSLLDLFCRNARAVTRPNRRAWRPFVAPFFSPNNASAVHLTPRFVSYFEVSILQPTTAAGVEPGLTNNNCVAIGVALESFDWHTRMPGWDRSSFGYHGDDGGLFHSSGGMLRKFGPSYGRGDVVGCGVDHVMQGIFFTLNGEFLGYGWTGLPQEVLEQELYPVVGIDTNDYIHCNFGKGPFQYDLKALVVKHEELVYQSLSLAAPLSHAHAIR